jgi:succinoglycan biosynthesis transport protein ExoP
MPDTQQQDEFTESVEASNPLQQWREYVHVLFERRWIAITTFLVIVVSAVIWNGRQTSMYQASSTLQVDMAASNIMNIPDVSAPGGPGYMFGQYINTQVRSLRSRLFIEKVVDALRRSGSQDDRDFIRNTSDPVGTILGAISVSAIENSRLIKITIKHPSPTATALLANAVADGFIKQDLARRMEISLSAVQWLREQAEDQKGKLMTAELAIQKYREDRKMVSLEQRQDIVVSKMQSVNAALTQAENALTEAEARWQDVEALWDNGKNIRSIPAIVSDP